MTTRPAIRPPAAWHAPAPAASTLANGLRVLAFRMPGQYVTSVALVADLPMTAEPRDREGVGALTAGTLDQGTATHPGTAFADAVEACGAILHAGSGHSHVAVHLDVPTTHLAPAASLLAEALADPELADADVDRHRRLRLAQLEQQRARGADRANQVFRHVLIDPALRSQRLAAGEADTVAAVTGADVRAFHGRFYGPGGATLVVAGEVTDADVALLADALAAWENPRQERARHETAAAQPPRVVLVDRPGSVQADLRYGWLTVDRTDPRFGALQIAAHALGGAYLSRLNGVLREEKGYTYGASLVTAPLRSGGLTYAQGSFRTEVVGDALRLLPGLVDVTDAPLTLAERDRASDYLVGVTPLRYATAGGLCESLTSLVAAGLGPDFIDAQLAAWGSVTPEEATGAAAELLRPDAATLVVVGDAEALTPQLAAAGFAAEVVPAGSAL